MGSGRANEKPFPGTAREKKRKGKKEPGSSPVWRAARILWPWEACLAGCYLLWALVWMAKIRDRTFLKPWLKPFFVGIFEGFLNNTKWIWFIHSMSGPPNEKSDRPRTQQTSSNHWVPMAAKMAPHSVWVVQRQSLQSLPVPCVAEDLFWT